MTITTRLVSAAVVLGVATIALAAPASAAAPVSAGSPYAQPLDALDGQTLAQYLADHFAGDPRLRGL